MRTLRSSLGVQQLREISLAVIILITLFIFSGQIENYFSNRTFNRISTTVALITVVAVGQTLVVLTRNVDLSVGSVVGFTAYFVGHQLSNDNDISPYLAVLMALGVGAGFGLVNGLLVAYGRVPAIVVTLGTLAIYRGILVEYSNSQSVLTSELPEWIKNLPRERIFELGGIELNALPAIALVVVFIFHLILIYSVFGRRLYAIGSSPEAAELAGIPSKPLVTIAFTLCGALAGLGGLIYLSRIGNITTVAAQGLELQVVAAVVVGGVNIFGGSGTVFGAMLGAILIGTIEQSLIRVQINEFWKDALLGIFILVAVVSDNVIIERLRNIWARTELKKLPTTEL